ncbi:MAG TPA: hypothetical protein VMM12_09165 [Longimicrobiales bacterium]|nr:hypothetical protein [Longimicrobiales bacterium]
MPSDELMPGALEAVRERIEAFRSAVAGAVDEVSQLLAAHRAPEGDRGGRAAEELGVFASGRIDTDRFGTLFGGGAGLDPDAAERVEAALETMRAVLEAGDGAHVCRVEPGGDLRAAVQTGLALAGRAFGAARAVEAARAGTVVDPAFPAGFPPERWSPMERVVAPPLVVDVDGADLRPAGLADYLEGGQALVLVVRRPAPPAALARLVTPGTLVVQRRGAGALDALAGWAGPAIVALVPEGAAEFAWLPDGHPGAAAERRGAGTLAVDSLPEGATRAIGSLSAARQESELALLRMLADAAAGRVLAAAGAGAGNGAGAAPVDPADRLAAWLLRQADVPAPGAA